MAKANPVQTNFTSGEVSPDLYGRVDINKYFNGAKTLENIIVRPQGGAFRRSGTLFCKEVKTSANATIIKEFVFSQTQVYVIEFGDQYFRVFKITDLTTVQAEVATPWLTADLSRLYFTQSADVLYVCHPSYQTRKISRTSDVSWTISLYAPFDGPYLDIDDSGTTMRLSSITDSATMKANGGTPFVVGDVGKYAEYKEDNVWKLALITAYTSSSQVTVDVVDYVGFPNPDADISFDGGANEIQSDYSGVFKQSDIGKVFRANTGSNAGKWYTATDMDNGNQLNGTLLAATGGQLVTVSYPAVILLISGRTISATLTASAATFASTDVGRWIRLQYGATIVQAKVTAYTSSTVVTVSLEQDPPRDSVNAANYANGGLADAFRLGAWSATTGWPSVCGFHEQRLWFANTTTQPVNLWGSKSGDYEAFSPTETDLSVLADNAVTYVLAGNQANPIVWMETGPVMLVGTIGAEWQVKATNLNEPITPANIDMKEQTRWGSPNASRVHRIGSATLFIQRGGKKLRELYYDFNLDAFTAKDITILSNHMFTKGSLVVDAVQVTAVERHLRSVYWVVLTNGTVATMTYDRDQEVIAWTLQRIGGTSVLVESICCVPTLTSGRDLIYMIVKRTINGSTKRYIERMNVDYDDTASPQEIDQIYVDSSITKVGSFTVFNGLDHLNGEEIQVLGDGEYLGKFTVSGNQVTLPHTVSRAHAGFKCPAIIQTLDPEGGSPGGTAQGKSKRIGYLDVRVRNTADFKHGHTLTTQGLRTTDQIDGLMSGNVRLSLDIPFGREGSYYLYQDEPVGFNVLTLAAHLLTTE